MALQDYIPLMQIPQEVHDAAQTLENYFKKQGMRYWQFLDVADRQLVTKLERERDEAQRIARAYRVVWEQVSAAVDTCPNHDPLPWDLRS
jgi:hypothetical protein